MSSKSTEYEPPKLYSFLQYTVYIFVQRVNIRLYSVRKYYSLGSADLQFGKQATGVKGLRLVFDSGSTYTYFNSQAYKALLSMVRCEQDLELAL